VYLHKAVKQRVLDPESDVSALYPFSARVKDLSLLLAVSSKVLVPDLACVFHG